MKTKQQITAQQGDVIIITSKIPPGDYERQTSPVVQHGEHGHFHKIRSDFGSMFYDEKAVPKIPTEDWQILRNRGTGIRYLKVTEKPIDLDHEEHRTVTIPPGEYEIRIVREFDHFKEEARQVID